MLLCDHDVVSSLQFMERCPEGTERLEPSNAFPTLRSGFASIILPLWGIQFEAKKNTSAVGGLCSALGHARVPYNLRIRRLAITAYIRAKLNVYLCLF